MSRTARHLTRSPLIRRRLGVGAAAVALAVALAACSAGGSAESTGDADGGGAATSELTVWADAKRVAALGDLAAAWGEENGVSVTFEEISEDLQTNFVTASQAGTAPDVVIGAHDWIGNLVQNGVIAPVNLADPDAFDPVAVEAVTFDGQPYGVPYAVENLALFRDVSKAPDAPATVEEMVAVGQAAIAEGVATEAAILPVGQNGEVYHMNPLVTSTGGGIFGTTADGDWDPDNVIVDSAETNDAMTRVQGMAETGQNVFKRSIGPENAIATFTSGASPFLISGPWALTDIRNAGIDYAISPIPGWEGAGPARPFVGVQVFYVAAQDENQALAQEFATAFGSLESTQIALYEAEPRPPALLAAREAVAADDPDLAAFAEAGAGGQPLPSIPQMAAVWDPLGKAEAAIVGGADVASTLSAAAEAIRTAIG
ncbi:extracellular solute-binding protein [Microbacterium sp. BK668]|uniref:sugar ABC transporter substrate-binding protein n=1 Tax=Microbacterium sp. BK668 TaxID=2512118 RepID=UPI00105FB6FB|nr:extracellular solute-binding protein [Microbacterium sp. BK668]TDN90752.1 carbohydrate ABC transporter substrate-binding protein (CUT1 family) [Microbacterium sp. BK668]